MEEFVEFVEVDVYANGFNDWKSITHVRTSTGEIFSAVVVTMPNPRYLHYVLVQSPHDEIKFYNYASFRTCGFTPLSKPKTYTYDEAIREPGKYAFITSIGRDVAMQVHVSVGTSTTVTFACDAVDIVWREKQIYKKVG